MYLLGFGFSDIGGGEVILLFIIALLLFGKQLPTVSRNIARYLGQIKRSVTDASNEIKREMDAAAETMEDAAKSADPGDVVGDMEKAVTDEPAAQAGAGSNGSQPPAPPPETPATKSEARAQAERPAAPQPPLEQAAALDSLQRSIQPPKKIPPPVV